MPLPRVPLRVVRAPGVLAALCLALSACTIPADPDETLDRVQERGTLRVGASPSGELVVLDGDQVSGTEAELAEDFAESVGATVEWRTGGEEELVKAMERGEIDLLIGGLSKKSAWSPKVGMTRPYAESVEHGQKVEHVLAVPLGENAMLSRLEEFLDEGTP